MLPTGHRAWTKEGLELIAAMARPLHECGPRESWRGELGLELADLGQITSGLKVVEAKLEEIAGQDRRVQLPRTIPGVGRCTAEVIVAHLDDAERFETAGQVSAYAGLVPRQFQLGETDRRGRIARRGPGLLRKVLVEAAWLMQRYNPWASAALFTRIGRGVKVRRKQALVAVARKLLVRCWAMLKKDRPWDLQAGGRVSSIASSRVLLSLLLIQRSEGPEPEPCGRDARRDPPQEPAPRQLAALSARCRVGRIATAAEEGDLTNERRAASGRVRPTPARGRDLE